MFKLLLLSLSLIQYISQTSSIHTVAQPYSHVLDVGLGRRVMGDDVIATRTETVAAKNITGKMIIDINEIAVAGSTITRVEVHVVTPDDGTCLLSTLSGGIGVSFITIRLTLDKSPTATYSYNIYAVK